MKSDKATFTPKKVVNLFVVSELDRWSRDVDTKFALGNYLIGIVKITKKDNPDKYGYSGFGIGFDACSQFSLSIGAWGKNVIVFCMDNSFSVFPENRKRDILVFGEGPIDRLHNTSTAA